MANFAKGHSEMVAIAIEHQKSQIHSGGFLEDTAPINIKYSAQ